MVSLKQLLFGRPFSQRSAKQQKRDVKKLNALIGEALDYLRKEHSDQVARDAPPEPTEAYFQSETEMKAIIALPSDNDAAIACKRAVVLFALAREPELQKKWVTPESSDFVFLVDLCDRVLPLMTPKFINSIGQRPDVYVNACSVVSQLWCSERMCIKKKE